MKSRKPILFLTIVFGRICVYQLSFTWKVNSIHEEKIEEAETQQIPGRAIPRGEVPEDLIGAMLFFLSEGANFITGQTLSVSGGYTMM